MRPILEKVVVPTGASWTLFHRRLPAFPFEWHYHPEYELTFTLNSLGQRYIGDHIAPYGDGDLALVGPNLPHTWQSGRAIDEAASCRDRHVVHAGLGRAGAAAAAGIPRDLPHAGRRHARPWLFAGDRRGARTRILALLERDQTAQVIGLIDLLAMLARDDGCTALSSPALASSAPSGSDDARIAPVLAYLHDRYGDPALSVPRSRAASI